MSAIGWELTTFSHAFQILQSIFLIEFQTEGYKPSMQNHINGIGI